MKILVEPIDLDHLYELDKLDIGGFIVGLKNYSIFQNLKLNIDEIKNIKTDKELYISINKPIHNNELDDIKSILKELCKLNITGVLFEDICIYNINKNNNLHLNLIWNENHLPTNYITCNYWKDKGCTGAFLSTELMKDDFIEIKKNTNMLIFVYGYGHIPIFESARVLLTNFFKHINKDKKNNTYYMYEKERNKYYSIYEEEDNTFITEDVLNSINIINELKDNNIDYIVINSLLIDKDTFNKELIDYIDVLNGKTINKKDVFTGFLFKESIFKVK